LSKPIFFPLRNRNRRPQEGASGEENEEKKNNTGRWSIRIRNKNDKKKRRMMTKKKKGVKRCSK